MITESQLAEGSLLLTTASDNLLFSDAEGAPLSAAQQARMIAPPASFDGVRDLWLGASRGGYYNLNYSLRNPAGSECLSANLPIEAIVARLETNAYYTAYGSTEDILVNLDPISHDSAGYTLSLDGAPIAAGQPPWLVSVGNLAAGAHSLTVQSATFPDLVDEATVYVVSAAFVDDFPDYSLDSNTDSDNFFLREKDGSGNPDSEDLDIYYRILPADVPVADVKIRVYKGVASTPWLVLDGEKNAGGYRAGDGLHITWTPETDGLAEDHPGFYRLQLAVSVEGHGAPVLETSIADADDATPGWQCPQDCLAVHDLVWKHRPIIHCHPDDLGRPSNLDRFLANVGGHTKELAGNAIITNTPPAMPGTVNTFYDLFDDNRATIGDLSDFTAAQRTNVLSTAAGAETVYHTAVPPGGTGGAPTHTFLQYWMFYNFSTRMFGLIWPFDDDSPDVQHEGDVEHCQIAVRLKDPARPGKKAAWITPFGATASQHYYAQTLLWDLNDGSAAANSHVQTHVEHQNNRLVIYVARGAHATYFVADNAIPVPVIASQYLGTQTMYDATAYTLYDLTVTGVVTSYALRHIAPELKTFNGRNGFFNPALTGLSANENGPAGLPRRAARISSTHELNLRANARELHNRAIRTVPPDQTVEMTIHP